MMFKQYHPMGNVVDKQGRRIKVLLSDHEELRVDRSKSVLTDPGEIAVVSWAEFCDLVSCDMVQLFVMGKNGPRVEYTEQELNAFPRRVRSQMARDSTDESLYWSGDLTLWDDCFDAENGLSVSVVSCRIAKLIHSALYIGGLWINNPTPEFIMKLDASTISLQRKGRNLFLASWVRPELNKLLREHDGPVSINTSSMMHLENQVYGLKMMGFSLPDEGDVRIFSEDLANCVADNPYNRGRFWGSEADKGDATGVTRIRLE